MRMHPERSHPDAGEGDPAWPTPASGLTRIEISKEYLNFSAGHFTIFSATERENLHGHNFQVRCTVSSPVGEDGLAFDYVVLKRLLKTLCDALDERFLLPARSPHLRIEQTADGEVRVRFAAETLRFLARDVLLLPLRNITVEELAALLLERLRVLPELRDYGIQAIELGVSSGLGQWAVACWEGP